MEEIKEFLLKNGFRGSSRTANVYYNDKCTIIIDGFRYSIQWKEETLTEIVEMISSDLNIYWLVGVLTWYGLIDKDYKQ